MAIAVYLLLLIKLPASLTFRFGLFNLFALIILLGWKTALGLLVFVFLLWVALSLITDQKTRQTSNGSSLMILGFYGILFFSFLLHKLNLGGTAFLAQIKQIAPWFPAEFLLPFFAAVSFSYIFVRCIDLARSCIWGNSLLIDPISLIGGNRKACNLCNQDILEANKVFKLPTLCKSPTSLLENRTLNSSSILIIRLT